MAFDKYITVKESQAVIGMYPSTMAWYCKEIRGDIVDLKQSALDVIGILNDLNTEEIKKPEKQEVKK